jgi:FkbM family methyltransferase
MSDALLTNSKNSQVHNSETLSVEMAEGYLVPYDESLLNRARTQWLFGEWEGLCSLSKKTLLHHPERAKLALLVAAGFLQTGNFVEAKHFICLAQDWGVCKKLLSQVLISGLHNTLGRSYLARGDDKLALHHFEDAIHIVQPRADRRLHGESRAIRQAVQIGLIPQAAQLMGCQLDEAKKNKGNVRAQIKILETEIELLRNELSLAQQRQQIFPIHTDQIIGPSVGSDEWTVQLKKKSMSQLGQDIWVLEKTNYKRGGFFVEFGATDGVLLSNTWLLEKEFGWEGVCIEPNPKFYAQLQANRNCKISNQCISGESGKIIEFVFADAFGSDIRYAKDDAHSDIRDAYLVEGKVATLTTISLHDFLIQSGVPREIDFISIDTEGSEYEILSSFPFEKWDIKLLTVEHNYTKKRENIRNLLEGHGYRCTEVQFDDWYEKIESNNI